MGQNPPAEIAFAATANVFPLATPIGWPFQLPNHTRPPDPSVSSSDTMFHAPPDPFVHVNGDVPAGSVTLLPALDTVEAVVEAIPPAVYPDPVSSVPDADPLDAVEVSFSFIAVAGSAVSCVPGIPPVPTGRFAFSISDERAASTAVCATGQPPTVWIVVPGITVITSGRHTAQSGLST
jgi:hypothetical protein